MKLKSFIFAVVALLAFAGNAWAQRDITSQYITNATLSNGTTGWTNNNFNTPQRGNNTVGYASECYAGWGSLEKTAYSLKQTITLPSGNYRLVNYSFYREGEGANTDPTTSRAVLKAGNQSVAIKTLGSISGNNGFANSQAEGANCFDSKMYRNVVEFTVASDNTQVEIGIEGTFTQMRSWVIAGMFELFDLDDVASVSSPTDVTYAITNSGFEYRNATGWTVTDMAYQDNNWGNKAGIGFMERWQWDAGLGSNKQVTQQLTGLENGLYEVSVYAHNINQRNGDAPSTGMFLYANNDRTEIGAFGQYKTRTTVTDGNLLIKVALENCTGNWVAFDRFGLQFYGDPLQAYKDLLAEKVAEAQALVDGGTLRTGAASQLQTIINDNDNDNDAFTTEAQFNTAVSNIEAGMTQANQIAASYTSFDTYKAAIQALSAGQPSSSALTTFNNTLSTLTDNVANATSVATVEAQVAALRPAGLTYISEADGTFDITFLASTAIGDWKNYYGNPAGTLADQFLTNRPSSVPQFPEFWIAQADLTGKQIYQTVEDLPAGYYQVGMYAGALSTSQRDGFSTEATEGDSDRTFAFAGDENDATSIMRTGMPIKFATSVDFSELTVLDVNVHLTGSGQTNNLTFGITKDSNGSNWHFAQIASIVYSNSPDLSQLEATRDALVSEAQGLIASSGDYLTSAQLSALNSAISAGQAADDFDELNTVTLTTLPNAINVAKQQIAQAKAAIPVLHQALERFEQYYNLVDGTDYRRVTMSAKAWTDLLAAVDVVTQDLDDISRASSYATDAAALNAQMDATDVSIRLFKSYKAMVEGCQSLGIAAGTTYATDGYMDTDATEQTAIAALNTAFVTYRESQTTDVNMAGFLGANLDFSAAAGSTLNSENSNTIKNVAGWEVAYADADTWAVLQTDQANNNEKLYIRKNWGSAATVLTASKLKMLPEGDYQLSFKWNSDMANMTNLSKYALGSTNTTLGEATSGEQTLTYDFTVTGAATDFDLIFGFQKTGTENTPAMIIVDDVELICLAGTPFQRAYDAAEAVADNTAATAAATSAITEYADYDGNESGLLENGERGDAYWTAVYVLRNAKTIADNNGDATSLVVNGDLTNTNIVDRAPSGWTIAYQGDDGGDIWIREQDGEQVYNIWAGNITLIDLTQTITNLPKGAYRLTMDMGTNNLSANGSAPVFNFINPSGMDIGASELVTADNSGEHRNFNTLTSAAEVGDAHSATIGVRSEGHYFQMKGITFEFIGDAATAAVETDNAYVRQDFFWLDKASEGVWPAELYLDNATKYANASNVKVYPDGNGNPNMIIHGLTGEFATSVPNADNGGTCANLVITDGYSLTNTREFTATAATYSRDMSRTWGTLLLPYPLTSDENVQFFTLNTLVEGEESWMDFTPLANVPANTPVVFKKLNDAAESVTIPGTGTVTTTTAEQGTVTVDFSGWSLEGTYAPLQISAADRDALAYDIYYVAQDKFWKSTNSNGLSIGAFRAYFHAPKNNAAKSFNVRIIDGDATRIVDIQHGIELGGDIYTVGGQLVRKNAQSLEGLPQGIYIVGGKKVVIK